MKNANVITKECNILFIKVGSIYCRAHFDFPECVCKDRVFMIDLDSRKAIKKNDLPWGGYIPSWLFKINRDSVEGVLIKGYDIIKMGDSKRTHNFHFLDVPIDDLRCDEVYHRVNKQGLILEDIDLYTVNYKREGMFYYQEIYLGDTIMGYISKEFQLREDHKERVSQEIEKVNRLFPNTTYKIQYVTWKIPNLEEKETSMTKLDFINDNYQLPENTIINIVPLWN